MAEIVLFKNDDDDGVFQFKGLHDAVFHGNVGAVRSMLGQKPGGGGGEDAVNKRDDHGNTPLLLAINIEDETRYNAIVGILIEHGADVEASNKERSPLSNAIFYDREKSVEMFVEAGACRRDAATASRVMHVACEKGWKGVVEQLLAARDDGTSKNGVGGGGGGCGTDVIVNGADDRGRTPVYIAAKHGHKDCLRMLIGAGADVVGGRSGNAVISGNETVMDAIFGQVSRPADFVIDMLDRHLVLETVSEKAHYTADFGFLAPKHHSRQMDVISSLLVAANDEEKTEVLQHPLIELFLVLKWARVRYLFFIWIAGYVAFVMSMSVYVTLLTRKHTGGFLMAARCMLMLTATPLLAHGVLQCLLTHKNRLRKYEMWLNLTCTSLSLTVAVRSFIESPGNAAAEDMRSTMPNWVLHVTSMAVLLAWTELMLLIGRLPACGYYALMFSAVLQNVVRVLLTFVCLVIGFALSFSIQFADMEQFSDPWRALVKTTVMMMGEFEYADLFADRRSDVYSSEHLPATSRGIFLLFIILTSIVLMNLMVGLAVSDIQSLQKESHARKLEKQADFLCQVEKVIHSRHFRSDKIPDFVRRIVDSFRIPNVYRWEPSGNFRRSGKLPCRLIDSLAAKAKSQRDKNQQQDEEADGGTGTRTRSASVFRSTTTATSV